jgi:hypothetical protein
MRRSTRKQSPSALRKRRQQLLQPRVTDPVDPLLPALKVICVVAPFTVAPVYQVPETAPVTM